MGELPAPPVCSLPRRSSDSRRPARPGPAGCPTSLCGSRPTPPTRPPSSCCWQTCRSGWRHRCRCGQGLPACRGAAFACRGAVGAGSQPAARTAHPRQPSSRGSQACRRTSGTRPPVRMLSSSRPPGRACGEPQPAPPPPCPCCAARGWLVCLPSLPALHCLGWLARGPPGRPGRCCGPLHACCPSQAGLRAPLLPLPLPLHECCSSQAGLHAPAAPAAPAAPGTCGSTPPRRALCRGRTAGAGATPAPAASSTPRPSRRGWMTRRAPRTPLVSSGWVTARPATVSIIPGVWHHARGLAAVDFVSLPCALLFPQPPLPAPLPAFVAR